MSTVATVTGGGGDNDCKNDNKDENKGNDNNNGGGVRVTTKMCTVAMMHGPSTSGVHRSGLGRRGRWRSG